MSQTEQRVVVYAEFTARTETVDRVEALLLEYAESVHAEPGNTVFDVYRRAEAPERFFVFEVYRDRAAFEAHLAAAHGAPFNAALSPLIVEDASVLNFLRRVEEK